MKILIFTENIARGGLDTFIINLINTWVDNSDEIVLVSNINHPGVQDYENGIHRKYKLICHRLFLLSAYYDKLNFVLEKYSGLIIVVKLINKMTANIVRYITFLTNIIGLRKIFIENKSDVLLVVNGGYPGSISCRAAVIAYRCFIGRNIIFSFHSHATKKIGIGILEYLIDRMIAKYSKLILSVSNSSANSIKEFKAFKNYSDKISYIYNGITLKYKSDLSPLFIDNIEKIKGEKNVCLMLATYGRIKGHEFLLQVMNKVIEKRNDCIVIACGDGSDLDRTRIQNLINYFKLNDFVFLLPFNKNIDYLFSIAKVLLITSQSHESFGLTAVEAMARRVPVITTNIGGLSEVVKDGQGGIVLPPDDIEGFCNAIIKFVDNDNYRISQGELGFRRFQELFTVEKMAKEYSKTIGRILLND